MKRINSLIYFDVSDSIWHSVWNFATETVSKGVSKDIEEQMHIASGVPTGKFTQTSEPINVLVSVKAKKSLKKLVELSK